MALVHSLLYIMVHYYSVDSEEHHNDTILEMGVFDTVMIIQF